jgi:hypothetical protein
LEPNDLVTGVSPAAILGADTLAEGIPLRSRLLAFVGLFALLATLNSVPAGAAPDEPGTDDPLGHLDQQTLDRLASRPLSTPSGSLTPSAATAGTTFAGFNSITPERLLDTRVANGVPFAVALGAGETYTVQIAGRGSVPADATAVIMNVTVDAPTTGGFVTVYPAGEAVPQTSNINMPPGKTVPNLVVMRLGAGGAVSLRNEFGSTHLIADVTAWTRNDGHYVGLTPARVLDTRTGNGAPAGQVGPGGIIDVQMLNRSGVPGSGVAAVVLNVTVDQPTAPSFVTTFPTGSPRPDASSLNMVTGQTVANLVVAPVGPDGRVSFFNESGFTHILADVVGYVPSGSAYTPVTPTRIVDTRIGQGVRAGVVFGGTEIAFRPDDLYRPFNSMEGSVGGPSFVDSLTIGAFVFNVTAAGPTDTSFLTVYPGNVFRPNASNLNTVAGVNVPNAVVVKPGSDGTVRIYNERGATHVIVDLVGIIPLRNALDAVDQSGGSQFHVVYLLGSDSIADSSAGTKIRSDLANMDDWFFGETGTRLDFARTGGQIDITTWRLNNYTEAQNVLWTSGAVNGGPLNQLMQDGLGYPYDHRYLVYIQGTRGDGVCGVAIGQFTTLFTDNACGTVGDVISASSITTDTSGNNGQVAIHEMLHGLGVFPTCAPGIDTRVVAGYSPGKPIGHAVEPTDIMYYQIGGFQKFIDPGRNDYWRGDGGSCLDLARSPYMANVAG